VVTLVTKDGTKVAVYHDDGFDILLNDEVVFGFDKQGNIFVNGEIVATDIKAVYGIRECIKQIDRGNLKEKYD
jgi:hypothetical protein